VSDPTFNHLRGFWSAHPVFFIVLAHTFFFKTKKSMREVDEKQKIDLTSTVLRAYFSPSVSESFTLVVKLLIDDAKWALLTNPKMIPNLQKEQ
jgi:hypothetical protein